MGKLNQSQLSEESRASQEQVCLSIPTTCSHWLGETYGKHGLGTNKVISSEQSIWGHRSLMLPVAGKVHSCHAYVTSLNPYGIPLR